MANVADKVSALIKQTVENQGVSLWDVRFVKEGASYYLRVFIDSEKGITIDDCVNVSHAIDPLLDEADPIDCSYCLEVSSPGIQRELTKPEHFEKMTGKTVAVKLFKEKNGFKEYKGTLLSFDGGVKIANADGEMYFEKSEIASVKSADDDNITEE